MFPFAGGSREEGACSEVEDRTIRTEGRVEEPPDVDFQEEPQQTTRPSGELIVFLFLS